MEYVIGVAAALAVFYFVFKRVTTGFNKQTLIAFPAWVTLYDVSDPPEKRGMARAFVLQALHLAGEKGVISASDREKMLAHQWNEDPVRVIGEWFEHALPSITEVIGKENLNIPARDVGMLIIVALSSANPQGAVRRFLERR